MEEVGNVTCKKFGEEYYLRYEEHGRIYDAFISPSLKHRLLLALIGADQDAVADEPPIEIAAVV